MTLCDISGEVNAKMWDGQTPAPAPAQVLRVRGVMLEYNGRPQLRVDKMRPSVESDDFDMAVLTPCAPEPAGDMMDFILNRADAIVDRELKALVLKTPRGSRRPPFVLPCRFQAAPRRTLRAFAPHRHDAAYSQGGLRNLSLSGCRPAGRGRDFARSVQIGRTARRRNRPGQRLHARGANCSAIW